MYLISCAFPHPKKPKAVLLCFASCILLMEKILHHQGCTIAWKYQEKHYQLQLVSRIYEPSTVGPCSRTLLFWWCKTVIISMSPAAHAALQVREAVPVGKTPKRWWVLWGNPSPLEDERLEATAMGPMKGKEHDLNQTSMRTCFILILRGVPKMVETNSG